MRALIALAALAITGCSDTTLTTPDQQAPVDGPLRLMVSDTPGNAGLTLAKPYVTTDRSTIIVTNTRYGSLCRYDLRGRADVSANVVELRITFSERLTLCTEELRLLSYRAEVFGLAQKSYLVRVIHVENNVSDTLVTQSVTLP